MQVWNLRESFATSFSLSCELLMAIVQVKPGAFPLLVFHFAEPAFEGTGFTYLTRTFNESKSTDF